MKNTLHVIFLTLSLFACSKSAVDVPLNPISQAATINSFDLLQDKLLSPSCATSGCHLSIQDVSYAQHGLVLTKGLAYGNLIGTTPKNSVAVANKLQRVKKFSSAESLLFHKLNWDLSHHAAANYGAPMPLGGKPVSKGQLDFVQKWIEAGAPDKGEVVDAKLLDDTTPSFTEPTNFSALDSPAKEGKSGFQLKVDRFIVPPNFEREIFVRRPLNNTEPVYISRIKLKSRTNSHHLVLYDFRSKLLLPAMDEMRDLRNLDNSLNISTFLQMSNHVFLGGGTDPNSDYSFPEGTALRLPANSSVDLNPHYFNKTKENLFGENYVNLYTVPASQVKNVVSMIDFNNSSFTLPPNQTTVITKDFYNFDGFVKGSGKSIVIVSLTSHTHERGKLFQIKIKGGTRDGEIIYEDNDWAHPKVINYAKPIVLKEGEGLTSVVTYVNNTNKPLGFGFTSDDEMNIIFGYYYIQ
jgi:hypothetical protein